jgi:hypothetical protein
LISMSPCAPQICRCIKSWSRVDRVCMTLRSMEQFEPSVPRQGGVNILIRARRDRQFESPFLQRRVWCESDFRARVPPSGVQFLGEGMAKSELGAKFFPSDGRSQEPKVCRLTAGGRRIRTRGPTLRRAALPKTRHSDSESFGRRERHHFGGAKVRTCFHCGGIL